QYPLALELRAQRLLEDLRRIHGDTEAAELGKHVAHRLSQSFGLLPGLPQRDRDDPARLGIGPAVVALEAGQLLQGRYEALVAPPGELVLAARIGLGGGDTDVHSPLLFGVRPNCRNDEPDAGDESRRGPSLRSGCSDGGERPQRDRLLRDPRYATWPS